MPNLTTSADIDTLMQAANFAAARTSLGLTALATTTPGANVATALGVAVGSAGAFVVNGGALGSPSSAGTIPAFTLGGTIAGGGNQLNNIVIGTTTPLAGSFTTVTGSSTVTGLTFVPTGSSAPTNGLYLPAANTLGWAINSAAELQLTSTALSPAADGGSSLGTTALGWQNIFANTGFVLNIENGNWVGTHTSGIFTVGTGDLRVSTAGTNTASVVTIDGTQTLGNKTLTSPSITTSIVTGSTTLAVFNTTATTVNAYGAATTLNIGASAATVFNFGGFTSAAEMRFLEPSGSGTNYSGFKQPALAASITYLWPSDAPANGDVLTSQSNGTLSWETPSGAANAVTAAATAAGAGLFWVSDGADRSATATDTINAATITTATVGTLVAGSATMSLYNTVATTINFAGVATALNIGAAAATVMNFGGHTSAAEMRYLEPSGSGTNYIGFKAVAMAASTTYTWPASAATAGQVLTAGATPTALEWTTPAGGGTVTVVGAGALTSTAFVTGGGTTTLQTPSTTSTLDSSGNAVFVGSATATRFVPSGSTVPTNGLYLPAANTLGWAINSAAEMQLTTTALSPAADGGQSLGTTALGWQNFFANTGFVLNIENSDWVATHTTGILTIGTGTLKITTPTNNATSVLTTDGTQTITNKSIAASQITAGTLAGTITLGEGTQQIALDPALSADGTYSGIIVTGTSGYAQTIGDLVYLDPTDSRWEAADANSASGADGDARGNLAMVVVAGTDGNSCTLLLRGRARFAGFPAGMTINNPLYVSETPGAITQTQPTTTDVVIRIIGHATTADEINFSPDNLWITHV